MTGYFDDAKNVEAYIKMTEGYDGRELIEILKTHLDSGAKVLELGLGPGRDYALLGEHYQATGSDNSAIFVERYRQQDVQADVVVLDAVTMTIERKFDGIYSNKVLHHLTKDKLKLSLQRQAAVLNEGGLLFHALWYGDEEGDVQGLHFVYYTEETFSELLGDVYDLVVFERYTELERDDSFYVVLRKR